MILKSLKSGLFIYQLSMKKSMPSSFNSFSKLLYHKYGQIITSSLSIYFSIFSI
ncbi:MAG: hypothetical protein Q8S84_02085 [bacterium]|nr:hypothetical protein [bacterium]MDP3380345.1 hypothetical protein [bacterium]